MGVKKVAEDLLEWIKNLFRTGYACPGNSYLNGCINDCKTSEDFDRLADRIVKCLPENDQNGMKQYYDMYMANGMPQQEAFQKTFEHYPIGDYLRYDDLITQIENKEVGISFVVSSVEKQQQMYNELKGSIYQQLDEIKKDMKENYNPSFRYSMVEKEQKVLGTLATLESHMKEYEYVVKMNRYFDEVLTKMDMEITPKIQGYNRDASCAYLITDTFLKGQNEILETISDIKEDLPKLNSKYAQNRMNDLFEKVEKILEDKYKVLSQDVFKNDHSEDVKKFKSVEGINEYRIKEETKRISIRLETHSFDRAISIFNNLCNEVKNNNFSPLYEQNEHYHERSAVQLADLFVKICEKTHPEIEIPKEIKDGLDKVFSRNQYEGGIYSVGLVTKHNEQLDALMKKVQHYDFNFIVNDLKKEQELNQQKTQEPIKEQSYAERHMDSVDIYVDKTAHDYAYQDLGDFGKLRVVKEMQDYVQKANKVKEQLKDVSDKETFVNHPEVRKLWGQFREIRDDVVLQLATAEASMTLMTDETEKQQMEFAIRKIEDMLVDCMIDGRNTLYKDFIDKGEINEYGLDKQAQFLNQIHREVENEMDFITRDD